MTASAVPERTGAAVPRRRADGAWPNALWAAYGSRVIVWVAAMIALAISPPAQSVISGFDPSGLTHPFHSAVLNRLLAPSARYDSVWYIGIAQHGYFTDQAHAFFPLYPLVIKAIDTVVNEPLIVGFVVSLLCFTGSLVLLYRLALLDVGPRAAALSLWLLALFPLSLYFSAVYTESIFTLLSIWSIYAARTDRWLLAGVMAGLASAARSDGFVLIVPLVWIYLWGPRPGVPSADIDWRSPLGLVRRARPSLAWAGLAPVGLIAFLVYCAASGSAFTAPFHAASQYWGRSFAGPFSEIWTAIGKFPADVGHLISGHGIVRFDDDDPLNWTWDNVIDVLWLVPLIAAMVACWRKLPKVYFVYTLLIVLASASNPSPLEPMMSFARYVMPAFPLFVASAAVLAERPRARWLTLGASGLLLGFFSAVWAIWAWVA
jgi:hypothetical protein